MNIARKLEPQTDQDQELDQGLQEDRGIPSINAGHGPGVSRGVIAVAVMGTLVGGSGLAYMSYSKHAKTKAAREEPRELRTAVPQKTFKLSIPDPPPPAPQAALPVAPTQDPLVGVSGLTPVPTGTPAFGDPPNPPSPGGGRAHRVASTQNLRDMQPVATVDKGSSSLMVASGSNPTLAPVSGPPPGAAPGQTPEDSGPLGSMLKGSTTQRRAATVLRNRDYLLAKGAYIDCALQTKIDTTLPGMTMCVVTRDVYSDTGKMLLVDRGSQITGEYQANMAQGQSRVFVVWNRIKTPAGVVIDLDSAGVDPLGAAGVGGYVDNHLGDRFAAAILLSLVQDVGAAAVNATATSTGLTLNNVSSSTQGLATETLKNTVNIRPSLVKNQGDRVGILVSRDLDFSTVYTAAPDDE